MFLKSSDGESGSPLAEAPLALSPERLRRAADLSKLAFSTTSEIATVERIIGQERALDAVALGTRIDKPGYNLFVIGSPGARMQESIKLVLENEARQKSAPQDWVYVNNFEDSRKPVAIALPAARAPEFHDAMEELIEDLKTALPAVFESEEYQTRRGAVEELFHKKQADTFAALQERASEKQILIVRTPFGFALAPAQDGKVVAPDEFNAWPEAKRKAVQDSIRGLERDLEHVVRQIPQWDKKRRDEIRQLNRQTAEIAVSQFIDETKSRFTDVPRVMDHLESIREDLVENVGVFLAKEGEGGETAVEIGNFFNRYEVNVLVTQEGNHSAAPIIEEPHPTLGNLIGRIEYDVRQGMLVTNFLLLKPGALHRANGGYLLLDIRNLLTEPFSWAALKRVLLQRKIAIEDVARFMGLTNTVSLEPDAIPLDAKIVLFGDRLLYFLLATFDPEVEQHFKVLADFENDFDRTPENEALMAQLVASMAKRDNLHPFNRESVARIIENAARLANHSAKLTLLADRLRDLLVEADFCAVEAGHTVVSREDVERAIEHRIRRMARVRDKVQESVLENVQLIDTQGKRVGQINGLSVLELAGFAFGTASRITCRVRPGAGRIVDIEREAKMGGPVHSKGVLILSGFLAGRYALQTPMSLSASLVFEQSYSGVEGDSASSAELCAILSALADVPLRQDLAATGSVNQHGEIQAIGGVNEKIEGFFDICKARGLTGVQGVIIPAANIQHLMLRQDVVEACTSGQFAVYAVTSIDQVLALLAGRPAGERGADGSYPDGSVNRLVEDRLRAFADVQRQFHQTAAPALEHQNGG